MSASDSINLVPSRSFRFRKSLSSLLFHILTIAIPEDITISPLFLIPMTNQWSNSSFKIGELLVCISFISFHLHQLTPFFCCHITLDHPCHHYLWQQPQLRGLRQIVSQAPIFSCLNSQPHNPHHHNYASMHDHHLQSHRLSSGTGLRPELPLMLSVSRSGLKDR